MLLRPIRIQRLILDPGMDYCNSFKEGIPGTKIQKAPEWTPFRGSEGNLEFSRNPVSQSIQMMFILALGQFLIDLCGDSQVDWRESYCGNQEKESAEKIVYGKANAHYQENCNGGQNLCKVDYPLVSVG